MQNDFQPKLMSGDYIDRAENSEAPEFFYIHVQQRFRGVFPEKMVLFFHDGYHILRKTSLVLFLTRNCAPYQTYILSTFQVSAYSKNKMGRRPNGEIGSLRLLIGDDNL